MNVINMDMQTKEELIKIASSLVKADPLMPFNIIKKNQKTISMNQVNNKIEHSEDMLMQLAIRIRKVANKI